MFSTYPPHAAAWFRVAAFKWGWGEIESDKLKWDHHVMCIAYFRFIG